MQPLNRWARQRLSDLAECLSDDLAVSASAEPLGLVRSLVDVASWTLAVPAAVPATAAGAFGSRSRLAYRVERLMDPVRNLDRPRRMFLALAGIATLATVFVVPVVSGSGSEKASSGRGAPLRHAKDLESARHVAELRHEIAELAGKFHMPPEQIHALREKAHALAELARPTDEELAEIRHLSHDLACNAGSQAEEMARIAREQDALRTQEQVRHAQERAGSRSSTTTKRRPRRTGQGAVVEGRQPPRTRRVLGPECHALRSCSSAQAMGAMPGARRL